MPFHPKIPRLHSKDGKNVYNGSIIYKQEKLDGSQFSFYVENGKVVCRSKNCIISRDDQNKLFKPLVDYIYSIEGDILCSLREGVEVFGECITKSKHNTLTYDKTPENYLYVFGIKHDDYWFSLETAEHELKSLNLGFDFIPFEAYEHCSFEIPLEREKSLLGGSIEGWVLKSFNKDGTMNVAKYVFPEFSEVNKLSHGEMKIPKSLDDFNKILNYVLQEDSLKYRMVKVIQQKRDDNLLEYSNKDIGMLCKSLVEDIILEEKDKILDMLWKVSESVIKKKAVKDVAVNYQRWLKENEEFYKEW